MLFRSLAAAIAALTLADAAADDGAAPELNTRFESLEGILEAQSEFTTPVAFDMTNLYETPSGRRYVLHFDPAQGWTYVDPDPSAVTEEQRQFVETIILTEHPEKVTAELPSTTIISARRGEIKETEAEITFSFTAPPGVIRNRGEPMDVGDALQMEIVIAKDTPQLNRWRVYNVKSFKPNNALKVREFSVSAEFMRPDGFDVDVLAKQENFIRGSAFLVKKVEEKWANTYSNYQMKTQ